MSITVQTPKLLLEWRTEVDLDPSIVTSILSDYKAQLPILQFQNVQLLPLHFVFGGIKYV